MPIYLAPDAEAWGSTVTVGDLVDRVYRDYLEPSDDQAVLSVTTATASVAGTEIVYDDSILAPDEEDLVSPGVIIEVGTEQMRVTDVDADTNTATVIRGVNGTTPAAVSVGMEIRVAPLYSRQSVADAVADNIVGLFPDLRRIDTQLVTSASGLVDVHADVVSIRDAIYLSGSTPVHASVELYRNWPGSATGLAIQFSGTPINRNVYITFEARFSRPTSLSDTLSSLGVDPSWERIIVVGAAAQVVAGRDLDPLSQEYIVEQMEQEGLPVGSGQRVRNGLLQLHAALLAQARKNLRADRVTPVVVQR